MLMEHYINGKPTGIIEPCNPENTERAMRWASAYNKRFNISIELSLRKVTRNIKII